MNTEISPLKALLERLRSDLGDDPDLLKQGFEDANALERQNHPF
jgi:hypothetical protein